MGEPRNRLRSWRPPQQSAHRPCVFFSLHFLGRGAFLTLPRAKPDDTAAERRSISASRNALAINVILKVAMASPPQIASASCTSSSIASATVGDLFVQPVTALMRFSDRSYRRGHTPGVTAIRALRMRKDQLQVGHTIHPSDIGRQASERLPYCHKESVAAYL